METKKNSKCDSRCLDPTFQQTSSAQFDKPDLEVASPREIMNISVEKFWSSRICVFWNFVSDFGMIVRFVSSTRSDSGIIVDLASSSLCFLVGM